MKYAGVILVTVGLALILFVAYSFFNRQNQIISPVPDSDGVKVIIISPGK